MAIGTPFFVCSGNGTGATTLVTGVVNPTVTGNAIVVSASCNTGTITGVTDSQSNTYVLAASDTTEAADAYTFYALNAKALSGSGTITVTYSSASASQAMEAWSCSGIAHSGALGIHVTNHGASGTAITSGSSGTLPASQNWLVATSATGNPGGAPFTWSDNFAPSIAPPLFGFNTGVAWSVPSGTKPMFEQVWDALSPSPDMPYGVRDYAGSPTAAFPTTWDDGLTGTVAKESAFSDNIFWVFTWKCGIDKTTAGDYDSSITAWAHSCQNYWDANVTATNPQPLIVGLWHEADSGSPSGGTSGNPTVAQCHALHSYVYPKFKTACAAVAANPNSLVPYGQVMTGDGANGGYHNGNWIASPANVAGMANPLDFYSIDQYGHSATANGNELATTFNTMTPQVGGAALGITETNTVGIDQNRANWFAETWQVAVDYNCNLFMPFFQGVNNSQNITWLTSDSATIQAITTNVTNAAGSQQNGSGPVVTLASETTGSTAAQTASATLAASTDWAVTLISLSSSSTGQGASLNGAGKLTAASQGTFTSAAALRGAGTLRASQAGQAAAYLIATLTAGGPGSSFTTQVIHVATATSTGDGFLIGVSVNAGSVTAVTDSKGNPWTLATSATSSSPDLYAFVSLATTALTTSDTITVTYAGAANATTTAFVAGIPGAESVDQAVGAAGTSGTPAATTGTLAQATEAAVMVEANGNGGGAMSWSGGVTTLDGALQTGVTQFSVAACEPLTSTAPFTATGTITSAGWSMALVTFAYTGGAGALTITTESLQGGVAGVPYLGFLAASGGTPPYTWALTGNVLPVGVSLTTSDSLGVLSGTPFGVTDASPVFTVTDAVGSTASAAFAFQVSAGGLTPPLVPVFPAGYGPGPSDFDNWITDTFGFLTAQVVFRAEQHTSQAINGFTTISYDTIIEDPYGGWSASSNYWLAPYTGWYEITMGHSISTANVVTESVAWISGVTRYELSEVTCISSTEGGTGSSLIVPLVGGTDFVTGQAWTSSSVSLDVSAAGRYPWIEIAFISQ